MPDLYNISPEEKLQYIKKMYHNPDIFARTIYPHLVYDEPAIYHHKFFSALYKSPKRLACIVPRGSSKTTVMGTIGSAYDVAFDRETFVIMIKKTYDQAFWDLDNIRAAIIHNDLFKFFFGKFHVERNARDTIIVINPVTRHRTTFVSLGAEQDVRGRLSRNMRISKLLLDDIESEKNTDTAAQRDKVKRHIYSNAMPGLDPHTGKVWGIGTIVHYDSWLNSLLEDWRKGDKSWHMLFAQARDEDGNPTWPSRFSDDRLKEIESEYAKRGMLSSYFMEYMNVPIADTERDFTPELINKHFHDKQYVNDPQYGHILVDPNDEKYKEPCNLFLGVDPSTGLSRDFSGFSVVAVVPSGIAYTLESYKKKLKQFELMDEIWEINKRYSWGIKQNIVEEQAAFKWLREAYNMKCKVNNRWIPWTGMAAKLGTGDKEGEGKQRIRALSYRFVGDALYIKKNHIDLIEELLTFPKGKSDDIADSLAYATHPDWIYTPTKIEIVKRRIRKKAKQGYCWMTGGKLQ